MRTPKRSLDLRKIRQSHCYTVLEVSNMLGVTTGTIRGWLRLDLPRLDDVKPLLITGDTLKNWLVTRRQSRKQKCQPDELYCCRCRAPRRAMPGSVVINLRNAKTIAIGALCAFCGAKMNKGGSLASLPEIKATFELKTPVQKSLKGCEEPAVNHHLEREPEE